MPRSKDTHVLSDFVTGDYHLITARTLRQAKSLVRDADYIYEGRVSEGALSLAYNRLGALIAVEEKAANSELAAQ
jgi:hypothetical protein